MARARVDPEQRALTMARLAALRAAGAPTSAHVRLAAAGPDVAERTVWRWLGQDAPAAARTGPARYALSATDREALAYFRGSIAAVARARAAVVAGLGQVAGARCRAFW